MPLKSNKNPEVSVNDLYALKVSALWRYFKSESLAFWLLCFYFFMEYVRLQIVYPAIDILPWGQIALLGTLFTAILNPKIKWVGHPINKPFLLFYLIIILSSVFAFMPQASWAARDIVLTWFLVYFLTISIIDDQKKFFLFILLYGLFNLKMAQHGAYTWTARGFAFSGWGLAGAPGWFKNSGEYAIQMLIFGSLSLSFALALHHRWGIYKKWLMILLCAMGYMAVMGASSRGAQLALLAIGIWALLKVKWGLKGLIYVAVVAGTLYTILPEEQMERFREMGEDPDSLQRLAYWEYGLKNVIPEHPVLGIGYHNWLEYLTYSVPEGMGPYMINQESHNIYIQAAADLGLLGLLVFLWLVVMGFITNSRTREIAVSLDQKFFLYMAYGLDAGLIGYLVAGSFVTVLYYPFFWVQIAMIVALNNVANNTKNASYNETRCEK